MEIIDDEIYVNPDIRLRAAAAAAAVHDSIGPISSGPVTTTSGGDITHCRYRLTLRGTGPTGASAIGDVAMRPCLEKVGADGRCRMRNSRVCIGKIERQLSSMTPSMDGIL